MRCMFIKTNAAIQNTVVDNELFYSYTLPLLECGRVAVIGEPVEGKGVPLLAVCSKATVDRRIGQVLPGWPAAALARSWDYVWYLNIEKRFRDVYLPLEIDLEMTSPLVNFVYRDLDTAPVPELLEPCANAFITTEEASEYHLKKSGHSTRSRAKKEKTAKAAQEAQQKIREDAARQVGPLPITEAEMFHVGDAISVEVGLGAMRRLCEGNVVSVEDRYTKNPLDPSEEVHSDQIVTVEVGAGQMRKFSAKMLRQNEKAHS